ncbi:Tetratricopeptide repeat (TPR)-like superfamily protein isoform 1, partial [Dorcoceras hygrometricum]
SVTRVQSYGRVGMERSVLKRNDVYKKLSTIEGQNMGSASVLNQTENEGRSLSKWDLHRVGNTSGSSGDINLRYRFFFVFNAMGFLLIKGARVDERHSREVRKKGSSDAAIQLDLIAKVDGTVSAELLNVYAQARMRQKAESIIVESLVLEMKDKHIELDTYSYNIWLSSCGSQGSAEKMEQVFKEMQLDTATSSNRTTFSTTATVYIIDL